MAALTVSQGGVPLGNYPGAEFIGTEVQPANPEKKFEAGIKWKWKIHGGPCDGQIATRITGPVPTPKNACGKVLSGLIGRALAPGESIDPDQYIGEHYLLIVMA